VICPKCDNEAEPEHTCPYASEIYDDEETLCTCCEQCSYQCAMDI
jgi:hypothetical protein